MNAFLRFFNKLSVRKRAHLYYSFIIFLTVIILLATTYQIFFGRLTESIDDNMKNVSTVLVRNTKIREMIQEGKSNPQVDSFCDDCVKKINNLNILAICDKNGVCLYHSDRSYVGKHIAGGDDGPMLLTHQSYYPVSADFLGRQRRYYHAIEDKQGHFIGFLVTAISKANIDSIRDRLFLSFVVVGLVAMLIIGAASRHMYNILCRVLMGHQPEEISHLIIQHQEVLDVMDEGIIAIGKDARVILVNMAAVQMFSITDKNPIGKPILSVFPESKLPRILLTKTAEHDVNLKLNKIDLLATRMPIMENGTVMGAVAICRNHTEVTKLGEKLTGVNHMVEALRTYTHEFTNKLHVILGLIECGNKQEAIDYIMHITTMQRVKIGFIIKALKVPMICALFIGKIYRAGELNIVLNIDDNSNIEDGDMFIPPPIIATIVGNILENAIENLNRTNPPLKEINVSIFSNAEVFFLSVSDTGSGMPPEIVEHIFDNGFSTKGKNRGTGLFLVKDIVDSYQGDIQVTSEEGNGSIFTISIKNKIKKGSK